MIEVIWVLSNECLWLVLEVPATLATLWPWDCNLCTWRLAHTTDSCNLPLSHDQRFAASHQQNQRGSQQVRLKVALVSLPQPVSATPSSAMLMPHLTGFSCTLPDLATASCTQATPCQPYAHPPSPGSSQLLASHTHATPQRSVTRFPPSGKSHPWP